MVGCEWGGVPSRIPPWRGRPGKRRRRRAREAARSRPGPRPSPREPPFTGLFVSAGPALSCINLLPSASSIKVTCWSSSAELTLSNRPRSRSQYKSLETRPGGQEPYIINGYLPLLGGGVPGSGAPPPLSRPHPPPGPLPLDLIRLRLSRAEGALKGHQWASPLITRRCPAHCNCQAAIYSNPPPPRPPPGRLMGKAYARTEGSGPGMRGFKSQSVQPCVLSDRRFSAGLGPRFKRSRRTPGAGPLTNNEHSIYLFAISLFLQRAE